MKRATGKVILCMTVDVEDSDTVAWLKTKEICQEYGVTMTWFVDPKWCCQPQALELLHRLVEGRDEVGLHIHWDDSASSGLNGIAIERVRIELLEGLKLLRPRFDLKSFRGGGLCQTTPVLRILEENGFEFDSSVAHKLDEQRMWHQGHENVRPVSAYYPSQAGYDVITYDDSERLTILEIPVTRGVPAPRHWCNLLEPSITPLSLMKWIFRQNYVRRRFQPLVIVVLLSHSWSWRRNPAMLSDLDRFLRYVSKHEVEFKTVSQAGFEWKKIWEEHPEARRILVSSQFQCDLKTRLEIERSKLAISIHSLRHYVKMAMSTCYENVLNKLATAPRLEKKVGGFRGSEGRLNVCFVVLSIGWAGAETVVYELVRHLRGKGISVSIVLNQEILQYYSDLEDTQLFNIGPLYPPKSSIPRPATTQARYRLLNRFISLPNAYIDELLRYAYFKKIRKELTQFLFDNSIDVLSPILEDSVPLVSDLVLYRAISRIAMVAGEGNLRGAEPVHPLAIPLMKWKARRFKRGLSKVDKVIGPSAFVRDAWEDQGITLGDKYVLIPNGVNSSEMQASLTSTSKHEGEFTLLFPGGARSIKGGDLLIECLPAVKREIPNIHVYVALNVPQNHILRKMVRSLELERNVTFVGFLPKQEYRKLLNSVDLLVLPSRQEGFGIVYLEAMALGKPIIAANTGGTPEVVADGRNGILVELDPDRIAEAIIRLYRDEDLRLEIGQNNLQDVARFDWSHIVDQYIEVYRETSRR